MKIGSAGGTRATGRAGPVRPSALSQDAIRAYGNVQEPADSASVMGIPEEELTPHVRKAIALLMEEVESLRQSLKHMTRRLSDAETLADQDPMIPVYNRRAFVRELTRVQASVERYGTGATLVYIDLNGFKPVNDTYGHEAGDYVLAQVAARLQESVRETDIVGRLGGDEFGLILSRTLPEDARHLLTRLNMLFEQRPIIWKENRLNISLSAGVIGIHGGGSAEQALNEADSAMYTEKRNSKAKTPGIS
ncbi:MAG: GGDEF domain-containing protein [Alphaproteobacteria bacterium]|nr:MAG: GGDEF domain-containing protein [Alphaproteobacteria bacterium]